MVIYLDFDGTVVEHQYPRMGRCNFGCIEVIHKLQQAGHKVLLNSVRCELKDESLVAALNWFENAYMFLKDRKKSIDSDFDLLPIEPTDYKHSPAYWDWDFFRDNDMIIIDDQSVNVPIKKAMMSHGWMVDWEEVDKQFQANGIYEPITKQA